MRHYHLAQINVGRLIAPRESPQIAGFMELLDPVNRIAEQSPGFVWRLQTDEGNATGVRAFDDPAILMNFSVWESIETLRDFTYKTVHTEPLRRRAEWFHKMDVPHMALWWIPAGHIPTPTDAAERMEYLQKHGESPVAFTFSKRFPAPDAPAAEPAPAAISLDNRRFAVQTASGGDCNAATQFHYRQSGSRVWATYEGGDVRFGSLVAVTDASGGLDMRYHHVDASDVLRTGVCYARPEIVDGGRLRLHEKWRRTSGESFEGETVVAEVPS